MAAMPDLARSAEPDYQIAVSNRLNTTGRTLTMPVPLKDGDRLLGEVFVQITAEDGILVQAAGFLERTTGVLETPVRKSISEIPDNAGYVPLSAFDARGVTLRFDKGLQELHLSIGVDQRPVGDLSMGGYPSQRPSAAAITPEATSGYLNIIAGLDHHWDDIQLSRSSDLKNTSARLELESAVRMGGIVVENRASYDGDVDPAICPFEASCVYGHVAGLKRQSSRAIYDLPEHQIRVVAGDTEPLAIPLQRATDLLGISIEKSPAKLNPAANIRSAGSGSFRLDRSSQVDVLVNGGQVQRLNLKPGIYTMRDLPLATGANNIELNIVDDLGGQSTLNMSAYSDAALLAPGVNEWAFSAGVPSYLIDNQRAYADSQMMVTGYFRYGLTDNVTASANLQGDRNVVMGGLGFDVGTAIGLFGVHGAASASKAGSGVAGDFIWSLSNFKGLTDLGGESLHFDAEYRSTDFHTPGEYLVGASGILFPEFNYAFRFNAAYSLPLFNDVTATLSGRYQFGDEDRDVVSRRTFTGDRYGADLTLSRPLTEAANMSVLMGYSNELYPRGGETEEDINADYRVALRLNYRPDDNTSIASGYDTLGKQSTVSAYRSEGNGVGRWDASVDTQARGYENSASVSTAASYYGNRAEARISHNADVNGVDFNDIASDTTRQRTSLRVGTAIAFAGDKVAVGAPVRGGAFAIVAPHESIAGKEIIVGTPDNVRAKADGLGNALVTDIPAYNPTTVPIDVADLPIGYSLGSGTYDTVAPYKAGYAIEVGSANAVSVYGTLVGRDGAPIALLTGTAKPERGNAPEVAIFTNAEGKFGAEGFGPGRWIIEMATETGEEKFVVIIPDDAQGLFRTGTLTPIAGDGQ